VLNPTVDTKVMITDIEKQSDIFTTTNPAHSYIPSINVIWVFEFWMKANFIKVEIHIIVIFFFKNIFVPSKLFQKFKTPAFIEVDKIVNLFKNNV
jgi:hypothetical protein